MQLVKNVGYFKTKQEALNAVGLESPNLTFVSELKKYNNGFIISDIGRHVPLKFIESGEGQLTGVKDKSQMDLTFEAEEENCTVSLVSSGSPNSIALEHSTDNGVTWQTFNVNTTYTLVNIGDTLQIRGNNNYINNSSSNYYHFNIAKKTQVYGDITSLLSKDRSESTLPSYCFYKLFEGCPITSAPLMPATQVSSYSYYQMFKDCNELVECPSSLPFTNALPYVAYQMFAGCTNLLAGPELPATSVSDYCYYQMFQNCTSMVTGPSILPPTSVSSSTAYRYMFQNCSSLLAAPQLPATSVASYAYAYMFDHCSSLQKAPDLPATTLGSYCYYYMFTYCTGMTTPMETLPAMTLQTYCYCYMFDHCENLLSAPYLPATTMKSHCYERMFDSCDKLVNVQETLPAMNLAESCYNNMFNECHSLVTAPYLPATTLASSCYFEMFDDNHSLKNVQETLPATSLAYQCYQSMYGGCWVLERAPELPASYPSNYSYCYRFMFYMCTSLNYIKVGMYSWPSTYQIDKWMGYVPSGGTFVCRSGLSVRYGTEGIPSGWTVQRY